MVNKIVTRITLAKLSEMGEIRKVTRQCWLETYVNKSVGVTKRDIESKFLLDDTPKGRILANERLKSFFNPFSRTWVVKINNVIAGYCVAVKNSQYNRVQAIYLLKKYQRMGLGRKLIEKTFKWFNNNKKIIVNVADYNSKTIGLYKYFGFSKSKGGKVVKVHLLPTGAKIKEIKMIKKQ